jgi:hypothetical protein
LPLQPLDLISIREIDRPQASTYRWKQSPALLNSWRGKKIPEVGAQRGPCHHEALQVLLRFRTEYGHDQPKLCCRD